MNIRLANFSEWRFQLITLTKITQLVLTATPFAKALFCWGLRDCYKKSEIFLT